MHTIKLLSKSLALNIVNAKIIYATQKSYWEKCGSYMNYPFIYEPTNCFSIFYTINLSTVTFGSFFCIILLLAHVDCNYFYFFGCHIYYSFLHFHRKGKTSKLLLFWTFDNLRNTWHHVRKKLQQGWTNAQKFLFFFFIFFMRRRLSRAFKV